MLTNVFVPCNGRFPALIALIVMFFAVGRGIGAALLLCGIIIACVAVTLMVTRLLADTLFRGAPSSFILELPPYRRPQFGKPFFRSVIHRTVSVLGRAVAVSAPAGLLLWILGTVRIGDVPLLTKFAEGLDGVGHFFGMDGAILLAFLLALPANEIMFPVLLMIYHSGNGLIGYTTVEQLREILLAHGWNITTAVCVTVFLLFHWPCSTTVWTIYRESGKVRYAVLSVLLPTATGLFLTAVIHGIFLLLRI